MARKKLVERLNGPNGEALRAARANGVVVKNLNRTRAFPVPWTPEEHQLFLNGVEKYGKGEWRKVAAEFVTTRTVQQVRDHAKGHFKKLGEKASGPNHWQYRWKPDEHERFMEGLRVLGKSNWTAIANNYVRTKSPQQVTSHAVKYFKVRHSCHGICFVLVHPASTAMHAALSLCLSC